MLSAVILSFFRRFANYTSSLPSSYSIILPFTKLNLSNFLPFVSLGKLFPNYLDELGIGRRRPPAGYFEVTYECVVVVIVVTAVSSSCFRFSVCAVAPGVAASLCLETVRLSRLGRGLYLFSLITLLPWTLVFSFVLSLSKGGPLSFSNFLVFFGVPPLSSGL